jgi:hypothetical protein
MNDRLDQEIRELFEELDRAAPPPPPHPSGLEPQLSKGGARRSIQRTPAWVYGVASAAAVVVVFGVGILVSMSNQDAADRPTTTAGASDTSVPASSPVPPDVVADESGAAPTAGTPLPDEAGATAGDDGRGPLPLGEATTLPDSVRLDFLFEFCQGDVCWRDAHFLDPANPGFGSGRFAADTPFHIRQGFINTSDEPLGDGFDVVVYVTEIDEVGEFGGQTVGQTFRYISDYVIRGTSEACGPTYRTQTEPETCEWFVHEFNEGLPVGRHALWAMWEAPCRAWLDYGFTDGCDDPDEVISLFSSGVDSPFSTLPPVYDEVGAGELDESAHSSAVVVAAQVAAPLSGFTGPRERPGDERGPTAP